MRAILKHIVITFAVLVMSVQGAWALGTLITTDGTTIQASRTLIIRHAEEIQIVTQVNMGRQRSIHLVAAYPNHNRPVEEGVQRSLSKCGSRRVRCGLTACSTGHLRWRSQPAWPKVLLAEVWTWTGYASRHSILQCDRGRSR